MFRASRQFIFTTTDENSKGQPYFALFGIIASTMLSETKLWLTLAEDDYKNAQLLWENRRYGATIFFYQQAVEKILKAYIVEYKKKAPTKTHRIEVLIKESGLNIKEISSPNIIELSKAYIRVRYPDLNKQYYRKRERVEPLVKIATEVYIWVKQKFKKT